ncbi:MAG TPA: hypothetical protein VGL38_04700 [bacterium]|jgi:anti-sigma factor RsiW
MKIEDAYRRLPDYLDGGLTGAERTEFERLLTEQPELLETVQVSQRLDSALRGQPWLVPSPHFTRDILLRIEPAPSVAVSAWPVAWERAKLVLSAAALVIMVLFYGRTILLWSNDLLSGAGTWVQSLTGFSLFALHPVLILGLIAPLLAGGLATCVLTGRCRLSS